jgi:hypothetical protein
MLFTCEYPPGDVNGGGPLEGFLVEISIFTERLPINWSMVLWGHSPGYIACGPPGGVIWVAGYIKRLLIYFNIYL